jgi:hypothetical protein
VTPQHIAGRAAARIVSRLGGFTLVIELVAAWLAKHAEVTCAGFLERLGLEDVEALDALGEEKDVKLRRHNDERRLKAVLDPTLDALAAPERRAMEYAAFGPEDRCCGNRAYEDQGARACGIENEHNQGGW